MESIIRNQIILHCNSNNLISTTQLGFSSNHSTVTNLLEVMNDITLALDNKDSIDVICIDFSKTFDSVSHKKLILKLEYYGINGSVLKWISSFLTNRTFCVKVNYTVPLEYPVISSVPQGSVLATTFFILFINNLCSVIKSSTLKMYADDVTIYHEVNNDNDYNNFKVDLSAIQTWALKW